MLGDEDQSPSFLLNILILRFMILMHLYKCN